jgi:hypothetical protein
MTTVWLDWATLVSSGASLIIAAAALIAFIFLNRQQRQAERQIVGATSRYMYEEMSKLLEILIENPGLRPFIYESRPLDHATTENQQQQVLAIAGLYSDFFEQLLYQRKFGNLSEEEFFGTWQSFITTIISSSSVLRDYATLNPSYYGTEYMELVLTIKNTLNSAAVQPDPALDETATPRIGEQQS